MMEYICQEVRTNNGGYLEPVKELIRCKDCRFRNKDGECTKFDAYTSAAGDAFTPPDLFYCGFARRKEE